MKRITVFLVVIPIVLFFNCSRERDEEPRRVNAISEFWVLPGSGTVYIQWCLDTDVWFDESPELLGVEIYRADSSSCNFKEIQWHTYGDMQYWGVLDSTVQDSIHYIYYIKVNFYMEPEIPVPYDISDTISVFPFPDAEDPIPDAPESLSIVSEADSFSMSWVPPANCDSLYYLLISEDNQTYNNVYENWYPNWFEPIWLSTPQYYFRNLHDGKIRYYKVIALVDSIISYPSECDSIKHE